MAKGKNSRKAYRSRSAKSNNLAAEAFSQKPGEILLETEPSREAGSFEDHMFLLYGPPKIGKSTMLSLFPNVYFLPTEPGFGSLNVRKTRIPNWATFTKFIKKMEKKPKFCKTVGIWCVDTADNLSKFCMQYVCGREGIAHPTDQEWGKGWEAYRDEFMHWILRLASLGPGLACISHEIDREIVSRSMRITKFSPALPKTTYTILNNLSDIIIRMTYAAQKKRSRKSPIEVKRVLLIRSNENYDAGDRTGLLPDKIFFKTEKAAVKNL